MAANTLPIYSLLSDVQTGGKYNSTTVLGDTASTFTDGTSSGLSQVYVGSGSNGNFVQKVIFKAIGAPAATVIRLYYGSFTGTYTAGTTNTAANTNIIAELTTATWALSQTLASPQYEIPVNVNLPTGTSLLVSFGTTSGATTAGWAITTIAGQY